jgi:hypothetical protein
MAKKARRANRAIGATRLERVCRAGLAGVGSGRLCFSILMGMDISTRISDCLFAHIRKLGSHEVEVNGMDRKDKEGGDYQKYCIS